MAQTKTRRRTKTRSSIGSVAARNNTRKSTVRGVKGGLSSMEKDRMQMLQDYANKAIKTARKIGEKGGAAAIIGGTAGVVIGAMAGAAITNMKKAKMTNTARNAAESISKHADDLKKVTR